MGGEACLSRKPTRPNARPRNTIITTGSSRIAFRNIDDKHACQQVLGSDYVVLGIGDLDADKALDVGIVRSGPDDAMPGAQEHVGRQDFAVFFIFFIPAPMVSDATLGCLAVAPPRSSLSLPPPASASLYTNMCSVY